MHEHVSGASDLVSWRMIRSVNQISNDTKIAKIHSYNIRKGKGKTYSRAFIAPITHMFSFLISPLSHLMFMLQLFHKMIYIPCLPFFLLLWSLFLLLQDDMKRIETKNVESKRKPSTKRKYARKILNDIPSFQIPFPLVPLEVVRRMVHTCRSWIDDKLPFHQYRPIFLDCYHDFTMVGHIFARMIIG